MNGRQRWKRIRSLAHRGPIEAFNSWCKARSQHKRFVKISSLDMADAIMGRILHDRAVSVRIAEPLETLDEFYERCGRARDGMAGEGHEWTPDEFMQHLSVATDKLSKCLTDHGSPVPTDDIARLELLTYLATNGTGA